MRHYYCVPVCATTTVCLWPLLLYACAPLLLCACVPLLLCACVCATTTACWLQRSFFFFFFFWDRRAYSWGFKLLSASVSEYLVICLLWDLEQRSSSLGTWILSVKLREQYKFHIDLSRGLSELMGVKYRKLSRQDGAVVAVNTIDNPLVLVDIWLCIDIYIHQQKQHSPVCTRSSGKSVALWPMLLCTIVLSHSTNINTNQLLC